MVGVEGIESSASCAQGKRSTIELYPDEVVRAVGNDPRRMWWVAWDSNPALEFKRLLLQTVKAYDPERASGGLCEIRTHDLEFKRLLL